MTRHRNRSVALDAKPKRRRISAEAWTGLVLVIITAVIGTALVVADAHQNDADLRAAKHDYLKSMSMEAEATAEPEPTPTEEPTEAPIDTNNVSAHTCAVWNAHWKALFLARYFSTLDRFESWLTNHMPPYDNCGFGTGNRHRIAVIRKALTPPDPQPVTDDSGGDDTGGYDCSGGGNPHPCDGSVCTWPCGKP